MKSFANHVFAAALAISTPAVASATCPSYAQSGARVYHTSDQVWTPQRHNVVAGGNVNLATCGSVPGHGYVIQNPDFTIQYDSQGRGRALEFRVEATCDTVLLVNSATAQWYFNDDDRNLNPRIRLGGAPSGQYDVWIGTFGQSTCNAQLIVESF